MSSDSDGDNYEVHVKINIPKYNVSKSFLVDIPIQFNNGCCWSDGKVTFEKMLQYLIQFDFHVKEFYMQFASTLAPLNTATFLIMASLKDPEESKTTMIGKKKVIKVCDSLNMRAVEVRLLVQKETAISTSTTSSMTLESASPKNTTTDDNKTPEINGVRTIMEAAMPVRNHLPAKNTGDDLNMKQRTHNGIIDFFAKENMMFKGRLQRVGVNQPLKLVVNPNGSKLVMLLCDLLWQFDGRNTEVFGKHYPPFLKLLREYICAKLEHDLSESKVGKANAYSSYTPKARGSATYYFNVGWSRAHHRKPRLEQRHVKAVLDQVTYFTSGNDWVLSVLKSEKWRPILDTIQLAERKLEECLLTMKHNLSRARDEASCTEVDVV